MLARDSELAFHIDDVLRAIIFSESLVFREEEASGPGSISSLQTEDASDDASKKNSLHVKSDQIPISEIILAAMASLAHVQYHSSGFPEDRRPDIPIMLKALKAFVSLQGQVSLHIPSVVK